MPSPRLAKHLLSSAATLTFCVAGIGNAADVTISGRIRPAGGECQVDAIDPIDYGSLTGNTLAPDDHGVTVLRKQYFWANVTCSRPTKIGLRFIDGQADTAATDDAIVTSIRQATRSPTLNKGHLFGLGLDRHGQRIGALMLRSWNRPGLDYLDDGGNYVSASAQLLEKSESGWSWAGVPPVLPQAIYSAALDRSAAEPDPAIRLQMSGYVATAIDTRPDHLDLANDVDFQAKIIVEAVML